MKKFINVFIILALITSFFTGCVPATNPEDFSDDKNKSADKEYFSDDIKTSLTIEEGTTVYINHEVYITDGATLTCNGAIFKFGPDGRLIVKADGKLIASLTTFTSCNDDSIGAKLKKSNGSPAANDWYGIVVDGGTAEFTECEFKYGGKKISKYAYRSVLYSYEDTRINNGEKGKMKIESCLFENNGGKDSAVDGTAAVTFGENAAPYNSENNYIKNCTFKNNLWPLSIPTDFSMPDSTNKFEDNKYQGIYVEYDNERKIGHNATEENPENTFWTYQSVPYCYMHESYNLEIKENGTLKIKGGETKENPTKILFNSAELTIYSDTGSGTLSLDKNITFDSYNSDQKWKGITSRKGTKYIYYYTSNEEKNIFISNADYSDVGEKTDGKIISENGDENY